MFPGRNIVPSQWVVTATDGIASLESSFAPNKSARAFNDCHLSQIEINRPGGDDFRCSQSGCKKQFQNGAIPSRTQKVRA
jgi:hypothetical protein